MVVREPVAAEVMSAEMMAAATHVMERRSGAESAAMERRSRPEATATEVHTAVAASADVHAATMASAAMTTTAADLRGQAFGDLPGHTGSAGIDQ